MRCVLVRLEKIAKILPTSKCHFHFSPDRPSDMKNVPYDANKPPFTRFTSVFNFSLNLYQLLNQFSSLSRIVKITFASHQGIQKQIVVPSVVIQPIEAFLIPYLDKHRIRIPNRDSLVGLGLHLKYCHFYTYDIIKDPKF